MGVISNKNTSQQSMTTIGRTGLQTVKWIPAPRIYLQAAGSSSQAVIPTTISNGSTPQGWLDLGTVLGNAKTSIEKKSKDVTTGQDNYYRGSYSEGSEHTIEFVLEQFDDVSFELVTALAPYQTVQNVLANYQMGSLELNSVSLLVVSQNKFDGKELQLYNPIAQLNFDLSSQGDGLGLKVIAYLPYFSTGYGNEQTLSQTMFSPVGVFNYQGFDNDPWSVTPFGQ